MDGARRIAPQAGRVTRDDLQAARLLNARLRLRGPDAVAPTLFVPLQLQLRIVQIAQVTVLALRVDVSLDEKDPRLLHVNARLHWFTWLLGLGLWHAVTWWRVRAAVAPLVPAGVRLQVRPW